MNDTKTICPIWESESVDPGRLLPVDLQTLTPGYTLIRWILELQPEVLTDWAKPVNLAEMGPSPIQPPALFTLIVYCYSTGVYASNEIEGRLASDPFIKYICAKSILNESIIRRFRRDHREAIITCLADILQRAYEEALRGDSCLRHMPPQSCSLTEINPQATLIMNFRLEARKRYLQAVQLDSMAMDV